MNLAQLQAAADEAARNRDAALEESNRRLARLQSDDSQAALDRANEGNRLREEALRLANRAQEALWDAAWAARDAS